MYSFKDPKAAEQRHIQYFEMFGNRALYKEGWIAVCRHGRLPWVNLGSVDFDKDTWELYDTTKDFSEYNDVALQHPNKLKELQADFMTEAKKYQVLPLDDRFIERGDPALRPSLIAGRTHFVYYGRAAHIPESSAANTANTSHTITATFDVPKTGGDGVIVAKGGVAGGYTLFIKHGKPTYEYNWYTQARYKIASSASVTPGKNVIKVDFKYDGGGIGKGGLVTLYLNDKKVGQGRVEKTEVAARFSADETFDTGLDSASPVSADYQSPFRFSGTIERVEIDVAPANLSQEDAKKIEITELQSRLGRE
jgi:hypothetical protein